MVRWNIDLAFGDHYSWAADPDRQCLFSFIIHFDIQHAFTAGYGAAINDESVCPSLDVIVGAKICGKGRHGGTNRRVLVDTDIRANEACMKI